MADWKSSTPQHPFQEGSAACRFFRASSAAQLGAVLQPIQVGAFDLISFRRSITGSPTSSPASLRKMMEFCVRHDIKPQVEHLPLDQVNQAIERLHRGDVRYRFVLDQVA